MSAARADRDGAVDVLAFGSHPDDVELGCGGTLAKLVAAGRSVGIVHLTRGERGTRGTPAEREVEARHAGAALGAATVDFLDCGDGALRHGEAEEDAVIALLRARRPEIVLAPPPRDRHPDHGRSHRLVVDSCFYAGLRNRAPERGAPHRPAAVFCYIQNDLHLPSFLVDVTATWERKVASLACYGTQLHPTATGAQPAADAPPTKISSQEFALSVAGRARDFGILIGVAYAEGFLALGPLAVETPWELRPMGLR